MINSKILLLADNTNNGLFYHRMYVPHVHLKGFEVEVEAERRVAQIPDYELKSYSICIFLRNVMTDGSGADQLKRCRRLGVKTIIDIDDYPKLEGHHGLAKVFKEYNIFGQTVEELKEADMVTCTTEHFAKWLRIHNKNVHVLPNCLDPEKWQKDSKKSNLVRFGWIGGVFHDNDLKLLTNSLMEMYRKEKGFQVVLGGWNQNKYYEDYERILSGSGIALSQEYRDWLKEKTFIHEHYYFNEPYRRIRGTAVDKYGDIYNEIDVALVPLAGNTFNTYKSEIKLVEAGMKGKAAIVSDTLPYNIFPKDTVMFVDSKDSKGWYKAMKKLMDKDLREELSVKLHEYVIKNYDLSEWNKVRTKIYKQWTQEN